MSICHVPRTVQDSGDLRINKKYMVLFLDLTVNSGLPNQRNNYNTVLLDIKIRVVGGGMEPEGVIPSRLKNVPGGEMQQMTLRLSY